MVALDATAAAQEGAAPVASRARRSLRRNPAFWLGGGIVILLILLAVSAPFVAPHDPNISDTINGLTDKGDPMGPTAAYPLGTDRLGRDYLSRLLFGARTSLIVGIGANAIASLIGVFVGATAAFAGNRSLRVRLLRRGTINVALPIDSLLMRVTDVVLSFPALLLAIALVAVVGASLLLVTLVIAAVMWTSMARIVYGRVLVIKELDWVEAAVALGGSGPRVFFRHILPHVLSTIIVYATLGIASAVLFEATLSYLGVGVPPPAPSWGGMIAEHVGYYAIDPRLVLLPGICIVMTILAFSLLGDALRDALDPTMWR
jgi:peptide/nickel transport system permease protein